MADIRVLVVDDEPLARRGIRQLLARHRDMVVVGECRDGREAARALETLDPDLVFLDVQMPGLDGFGVLGSQPAGRKPAVVFVTAFDEFAVRAFEANAVDYLVKPLAEARFEATLARVRDRLRRTGTAPEEILVPTATGRLLLDTREIGWIEARDYYACVHAGAKRYLVRESLRALERELNPAHFLRVHRGAIVRLDQVRELRASTRGLVAILRDGSSVPVSRRRRERLKSLLHSRRP